MSIASAEQNYLAFNTGNKDNPRDSTPVVRGSARWLVDYDGITKNLLKGQYFTHQSFLPVGFPGALEETPFTFNPAKAKEILAKAGIKTRTSRLMSKINRHLLPSRSQFRPALLRAV